LTNEFWVVDEHLPRLPEAVIRIDLRGSGDDVWTQGETPIFSMRNLQKSAIVRDSCRYEQILQLVVLLVFKNRPEVIAQKVAHQTQRQLFDL
jgi:hypothetical protein